MSSSMLTHRANKCQKLGDSVENILCTHLAFNQVCKRGNPPTEKFLCLLLWQELTLFPAFACHSPGNVTKCFSEVNFFPYSQLLFPTKIAASGKGILARADTKGELQSSASFPNHLELHCKCHISRDSYHRGAAAAVQTPKNPCP